MRSNGFSQYSSNVPVYNSIMRQSVNNYYYQGNQYLDDSNEFSPFKYPENNPNESKYKFNNQIRDQYGKKNFTSNTQIQFYNNKLQNNFQYSRIKFQKNNKRNKTSSKVFGDIVEHVIRQKNPINRQTIEIDNNNIQSNRNLKYYNNNNRNNDDERIINNYQVKKIVPNQFIKINKFQEKVLSPSIDPNKTKIKSSNSCAHFTRNMTHRKKSYIQDDNQNPYRYGNRCQKTEDYYKPQESDQQYDEYYQSNVRDRYH